MYRLYVWFIPHGNKYYHKLCKGTYRYNSIGCINQYGHELVHIIDLNDFLISRNYKVNYRKMLINDTIRLLEKLK